MRCLVTGAAGFAGYRLTAQLAMAGHEVVALDRRWLPALHALGPSVTPASIDLVTEHCLPAAALGCNVAFHLAATRSIPYSILNPEEVLHNNVLSTVSMLEACRAAGVRRFVFASSSSVYGGAVELPTDEDQPIHPISPYSASKIACEAIINSYAESYGIEQFILRLFNIYGARRPEPGGLLEAVPAFVRAAISGERPRITGDGGQARDFIHVSDVASAFIAAALAPAEARGVYNIGSGRSHTLLEAIEAIKAVVPHCPEPVHEAARTGDIRTTRADITKAREKLGWMPAVSFEKGITLTAHEYRMLESIR